MRSVGYYQLSIQEELGPSLSSKASIITSDGPRFRNATTRWQDYASPSFQAVVEVVTEADVVATVQYANKHSLPFFATSGGHAASYALAGVQEGIQIWTDKMNSINVQGDTALIQGGVTTFDVVNTLWAAGKQTVTGLCEANGIAGPILGGGHGLLQGRYGLVADQIISARIILANGTVVEVSDQSNPDLFWTIKGAGHNFGIISEMVLRIYDVGDNDSWAYETMAFPRDAIEAVVEQMFETSKNQPAQLMTSGAMLPSSDPSEAALLLGLFYNGPSGDLDAFSTKFRELAEPIEGSVVKGTALYVDLPPLLGSGKSQPISIPAAQSRLRFPIDLNDCKPSAYREAYDVLNTAIAQDPRLNQSTVLIEGYPKQGVEAIPSDSTAVPVRNWGIRNLVVMLYDNNPSLDDKIIAVGKDIRSKLQAGSSTPDQLRAYVNYAMGDEDLESMYGYEHWRIPKLLKLKDEYDPTNAFRWFNPLVR